MEGSDKSVWRMSLNESGMQGMGGLVAIVTGGASGIGAAVARSLASAGAHVAIFDLRVDDVPAGVFAATVDIADDDSVRAGVDAVVSRFGGVDVLVNNAGVGAQGTVESNPDDEWHRVYDINVVGPVRVSRAVMPWLRRSESAAIVNVCSAVSDVGFANRALYGATKGALSSLTRHMAADHLREGIRVNSVKPGTADTPWINHLLESSDDPEAERAALIARQPHRRLVSPDEIAGAVLYLASPMSGSTTGVSIPVDGGLEKLRLLA